MKTDLPQQQEIQSRIIQQPAQVGYKGAYIVDNRDTGQPKFVDNRDTAQMRLMNAIQRMGMEEEELQMKPVVQLQSEEEDPLQGKFDTIQQKPNNTGLPDNLKLGVENMSGFSMDDVRVHYNSDKPAKMQAHAYAQGTDIHVAPGQKKHLPHEAWHVVQQKQGRVRPTMQMHGINVNNDNSLENEADVMGNNSLGFFPKKTKLKSKINLDNMSLSNTAQLYLSYTITEQNDIKEDITELIDLKKGIEDSVMRAALDVLEIAIINRIVTRHRKGGVVVKTEVEPSLPTLIKSQHIQVLKDKRNLFNDKLRERLYASLMVTSDKEWIDQLYEHIGEIPSELLFSIDADTKEFGNISEVLAMHSYCRSYRTEELGKLRRSAGSSVDFTSGTGTKENPLLAYDPVGTPLNPNVYTTYEAWKKYFDTTLMNHASKAKAILDLTYTPMVDLEKIKTFFSVLLRKTKKGTQDIKTYSNIFVVHYADSFMTKEAVDIMDEIAVLFNVFRDSHPEELNQSDEEDILSGLF